MQIKINKVRAHPPIRDGGGNLRVVSVDKTFSAESKRSANAGSPMQGDGKRGHRADSPLELRFITRIFKSWRVHVTYGSMDFGQDYFKDVDYGGKAFSLQEAKYHRDELVEKNQIPLRVYDGNGFNVRNSKNSSQAVGVFLSIERTSAYWVAAVMMDGEQRKFRKSIRQYGYLEAWRLAVDIRASHTGLIYPPEPPVATGPSSFRVEFDSDNPS